MWTVHRILVVYITTASCLFHSATHGYNTTSLSDLQDALLTNYKPMSNIDQELSFVGFFILYWQDTRLTWNATDYDNATNTYMKNSQIWTPPIVLANSADGIRLLSDDSDTETMPIHIEPSGLVTWLAAANYVVQCPVDITFYPFDSQTCSLKVSTWMHEIREVSLANSESSVNLELYEENGEWDLTDTGVSLGTRSLHGHPMSMADFTLKLTRKHSYYILNMILPVVFTSFLGCLVFLLPMESGEKNGFALTILLSLSVIMTIVSDKIPPTSTHVCILSVYLLCALTISVCEVLVTVFIQRVHHKGEDGRNPPEGQLQQFARFLAKVTRHTTKTEESNPVDDRLPSPESQRKTKIFPLDLMQPPADTKLGRHLNAQTLDNDENKRGVDDGNGDAYCVGNTTYDYKDISVCLDKICFYVFLVVTLILTLTFLLRISVK